MKRLDQAQARALATIRNQPDFAPIRRWLDESLHEAHTNLRTAEGQRLHQWQGEAATLAEILDKIDYAREIANKHGG